MMAELKSLHPLPTDSEPSSTTDFLPLPGPPDHQEGEPQLKAPQSNFVRRYVAKRRRCHILKNLAVICIAFLLNFTAFQNIQNLQSSLNPIHGLGTMGLAVLYGVLCVSSILLPSCLIDRFSSKWTLTIAIVPYFLYILANFYPTWATILPAAALLGLGAAPLWAAKCTYLTESAVQLARITGEPSEAVIGRFFGIFFMAFQSTQIWGNLISGFILQQVPENGTLVVPPDEIAHCGPMFCTKADRANNTNLDRPGVVKIYTLLGTYLCLCLLALLTLALCLDKLSQVSDVPSPGYAVYPSNGTDSVHGSSDEWRHAPAGRGCECGLLMATVEHWKDKRLLLLVPLTMYSGLEQAFIASDYTRSYVSCTLGVWMVGMVMICFGITNTLGSLVLGYLLKFTGRTPLFVTGTFLHAGLLVTLFLWQPDPSMLYVYFLVAGLWGFADAIWQTQINSLYGCLFTSTKEAAFSNYRLWESTGFIIGFGYSNFLCTYVKIYIVLSMLILGILGYFIVECGEKNRRREVVDINSQ